MAKSKGDVLLPGGINLGVLASHRGRKVCSRFVCNITRRAASGRSGGLNSSPSASGEQESVSCSGKTERCIATLNPRNILLYFWLAVFRLVTTISSLSLSHLSKRKSNYMSAAEWTQN